ncbi:hypothetical protein A0H81_02192 [Grifola frondosa]|uniref:Ribonuclease H1 N-terminal domain-containing protein n=1 Tax=Grifola frondosa TaxID=5627 RepID=A0A1C7MLJ8_GRIFR|nr:hypothetical protein A0H81_02192 [Grifola frondosa]
MSKHKSAKLQEPDDSTFTFEEISAAIALIREQKSIASQLAAESEARVSTSQRQTPARSPITGRNTTARSSATTWHRDTFDAAMQTVSNPAPVIAHSSTAPTPNTFTATAQAPVMPAATAPTPVASAAIVPVALMAATPAPDLAATAPAPVTPVATAATPTGSGAIVPTGTAVPTGAGDHGAGGVSVAGVPVVGPENGRWYIVTKGRKVGVFYEWSNTGPHVSGVSGAICARYYSRTQAIAAYESALAQGLVHLVV